MTKQILIDGANIVQRVSEILPDYEMGHAICENFNSEYGRNNKTPLVSGEELYIELTPLNQGSAYRVVISRHTKAIAFKVEID